jgi:hypothetical protein
MKPNPIFSLLTGAGLTCGLFIGSGCATTYDVSVDAITQPKPKDAATSYRIKNKNPTVEEDNLRYKEATNYVRTALSGHGMYEAPADVVPDVIVEIEYGVEPPSVRMERTSVPIYSQSGGGVRYNPMPVPIANGSILQRTVPVYDAPDSQLVGYQEVVTPVAVYEKYLHISARENKPKNEGTAPTEIWSVNTSFEDESKDIRKYLPLLASASMESIGTDTGSRKTIKLKESDQNVDFVKKGL